MRRWLEAYRHLKIRNKLSVLIALIMLVTFGFTLLVQQYAFASYDEQLYGKSAQALNLSSAAIETELKRIQQVSYNIIADPQVQNALLSIKRSSSEYDRYLLPTISSPTPRCRMRCCRSREATRSTTGTCLEKISSTI